MNDLLLALGILLSVLAVTYALYLKNRKEKKQHALEKKDKILNNLRSSCLSSDDLESRKDDEVASELAEIRKLLALANATFNTPASPASPASSGGYKTAQGVGLDTARKLRTHFDIGAQTAIEKLDDSLQKSFIFELDQNFLVRGNNPDHLSNFISQGGAIKVSGSKPKTGRSIDIKGRVQTKRSPLKP